MAYFPLKIKDGSGSVHTVGDPRVAAKADKYLTVSTQTASYTLALSDAGKMVEMSVASANTLTVPPNSSVAFPVGTVIPVTQSSTGFTTITPGSGVTIVEPFSRFMLRKQNSTATLVKRATNTWVLYGDVVAAATYPVVTGGTLYSDDNFYYRVFAANGTLSVSNAPLAVEILCVGGGGGGGGVRSTVSNYGGGGGGGAEVRGSQTTIASGVSATVVVGAGGSGGSVSTAGGQGSLSSVTINSVTYVSSTGGGGGGGANGTIWFSGIPYPVPTGNGGFGAAYVGGNGGATPLISSASDYTVCSPGSAGTMGGGGGGWSGNLFGSTFVLSAYSTAFSASPNTTATGARGNPRFADWTLATGTGWRGAYGGGGCGSSVAQDSFGAVLRIPGGGGLGIGYSSGVNATLGTGLTNTGGGGAGASGYSSNAGFTGNAGGSGVVIFRYARAAVGG